MDGKRAIIGRHAPVVGLVGQNRPVPGYKGILKRQLRLQAGGLETGEFPVNLPDADGDGAAALQRQIRQLSADKRGVIASVIPKGQHHHILVFVKKFPEIILISLCKYQSKQLSQLFSGGVCCSGVRQVDQQCLAVGGGERHAQGCGALVEFLPCGNMALQQGKEQGAAQG